MRRLPLPILVQVCALALAAVLASQAIAMAAVLLWPPPLPMMTVPQALAGLRDQARAGDLGLRRRLSPQPPFPADERSRELAAILARELGRPLADVRVRPYRWTSRGDRDTRAAVTAVTLRDGGGSRIESTLSPRMLDALVAVYVGAQLPQPAFEAALRTPDGWLVVGPDRSWLLRWRAGGLAFLLGGLLVLVPLVWWVARRLTGPVRALADAAGQVGQDGVAQVGFPARGPREIVAVAEALNAMQARLLAQVGQRMRMLLAVAHDLRTPLTGLRLRIEMVDAAAEQRQAMVADVRRIERMVDELMGYSAASREGEAAAPLDLRQCVAECIRTRGHDAGIRLQAGPSPRCMAGAVRCARTVGNLLDNAVKYGGGATLSIACRDGKAVLEIADDGPGIPERELEAVFEPFYRGEQSRSRRTGGIGLGLAIARECAQRDGGTLQLRNRPGGGLSAILELPLAPPGAPPGASA